jgi:formylglycine-generating enzyme required for sulfatase activity
MDMKLMCAAALALAAAGASALALDAGDGAALALADTSIDMVVVPAGSFVMGDGGAGETRDEGPAHVVTFARGFRMGVTEVTNVQYEEFFPEHRALRGKDGVSTGDDDAVVNVSWYDAKEYCRRLSEREGVTYRLPTEAEWEYACRAGTATAYFTGDTLPAEMCRNQVIARDYVPVSLRVGMTAPNAFGLCDMHGNVEEWCEDWYGPYSADAQTDPVGAANGVYRVTRGGSHHTPVQYLRSANRMAMLPDDRHSLTGFRVVQAEYPAVAQAAAKPFFKAPQVYVVEPETDSVPFYAHNHQPAITECDNGDLLAAWFSANQENGRGMVVLSSRLEKGADAWQPAQLFFSVPDRNVTGTSLRNDGHGMLIHLNGVEAAGDWQNLMMVERVSTDNGLHWSAPRIVAGEHTKRHQVIAGCAVTSRGWMLQTCDAGPGSHDGAAVHVSRDGGYTWQDPWDGAPLPEFSEGATGSTIAGIHAGIVELRDGSWMALGRGNSIADANGKPRMPMSISTDEGKTWTYHASELPPIDGGQRLVLLRLKEGPLLLVSFTDHPERTAEADRGMMIGGKLCRGMYAAVSYDEGRTWPVRRLLTDGVRRELNGGAWTGDFVMDDCHAEPKGYLAGVQATDGTIHIVSSRLHYQFNLAWIEEGAGR